MADILFVVPAQYRPSVEELIGIVEMAAIVVEPNLQVERFSQLGPDLEVELVFGKGLSFKNLDISGGRPGLELADCPAEQ